MTEIFTYIRLWLSIIGGLIMKALGGCDALILVLLGFVCVDYISGVVLAIRNRKLNSRAGFYGLLKKAMILLVIFLAHLLDIVTGFDAIRSMAVMFYISNEGISILENLGKLGVAYPQKLKDILEQLEDEKNDNSENTKSDN